MTGRFGLMPFSRHGDTNLYARVSPKTALNLKNFAHIGKEAPAAAETNTSFGAKAALTNVFSVQVDTGTGFNVGAIFIEAYHFIRPRTDTAIASTLFGQKFVLRGADSQARFRARGHAGKIARVAYSTLTRFAVNNGAAIYSRMRPVTASRFGADNRLALFMRRTQHTNTQFAADTKKLRAYAAREPLTLAVFGIDGHIGKEMPLGVGTGSIFAAVSHVGKKMRFRAASFASFNQQGHVGKYVLMLPCSFTWFEALSHMLMFEIETAEIRTLIPPGGRLVIDSHNDALTAQLDGVNILHLYRGAWIRLHRNSYMVDIHTATGGSLEAEINYEDRYL